MEVLRPPPRQRGIVLKGLAKTQSKRMDCCFRKFTAMGPDLAMAAGGDGCDN